MKLKKEIKLLTLIVIMLFFLSSGVRSTVNGAIPTTFQSSSHVLTNVDTSNWEYTPLELISTVSATTSYVPSIAVDKNNVHIVWLDYQDYLGSGVDGAILYRYWNEITQSWTTTEFLSGECDAASLNPVIVVDALDNLHVVWEDTSTYGSSGSDKDIMYRCFNATTLAWQTTEVVSTESTAAAQNAVIVTDHDNNPHVVWVDSTDDDGNADNDIYYKYKDIQTDSWISTKDVSGVSASISAYPSLAIDSVNDVHIVWQDAQDYASCGTDWDIFYRKYYPESDTWGNNEVISTISGDTSDNPKIAIDLVDNVYIAWEENEDYYNSGTNSDIVYRRFIKSLDTWDIVEVVSVESVSNAVFSYLVNNLVVDQYGNVHFLYMNNEHGGIGWDVIYRILYTAENRWGKLNLVSFESNDESYWPAFTFNSAGHVYFAWGDATSNMLGSGSDYDIFFKKFAGPPGKSILHPIVPNPSDTTSVFLNWEPVPGAINYIIYRSTNFISSVEELGAHDATDEDIYIDVLGGEGIYYYVVVAENPYGQGYASNCEFIHYIPPSLREFAITTSVLTSLAIIAIVFIKSKRKK